MSDLIRREDAIKAINKAFDRETLVNAFVRKVAVDAVKAIPSEPEKVVVEVKVDTDEIMERLKKEIFPLIPHWIPCSERLPSDGEYVLVTEKWHGYIWMWRLQYIDDEPRWDVNGYNIDIDEAVAWMPLPEPYRKEGDNETD